MCTFVCCHAAYVVCGRVLLPPHTLCCICMISDTRFMALLYLHTLRYIPIFKLFVICLKSVLFYNSTQHELRTSPISGWTWCIFYTLWYFGWLVALYLYMLSMQRRRKSAGHSSTAHCARGMTKINLNNHPDL